MDRPPRSDRAPRSYIGTRRPSAGTLLLVLLVAAGSAGTAGPAAAQFGPGPRALGTAGALVGLARGFESAYWNPANLALPDAPAYSVGIVRPAAAAAALGPDLRQLGILTGSDATAAERAAFLDGIPATGLELRGDVTVPWLSASVGPFGLGVATTALAQADASRSLVELYLDARDDGRLDGSRLGSYRVGDTGYRDAAFTHVTAAYGVPLEIAGLQLTVGAGARLVVGHRLDRGRLFEPVIHDDYLVLTGLALRSTGGRGFGLDLGATARPAEGVTVGLAVENAFHRMRWDDELELLGGDVTTRDLAGSGLDAVMDRFEGRPFDPAAVPLETYEIARELLIEAYQPRVVRAGAAYEQGETRAGVTISSTVGGGNLRAGWPRYVALGIEQKLHVLELRAGYAHSMAGASAVSLGSGLRVGPARLMASAARITGSGDPLPRATDADGWRYGDRLTSGSGYAVTLGLSITASPAPSVRARYPGPPRTR